MRADKEADAAMTAYLAGKIPFKELIAAIDREVSSDLARLMPIWTQEYRKEQRRQKLASRLRKAMP